MYNVYIYIHVIVDVHIGLDLWILRTLKPSRLNPPFNLEYLKVPG